MERERKENVIQLDLRNWKLKIVFFIYNTGNNYHNVQYTDKSQTNLKTPLIS